MIYEKAMELVAELRSSRHEQSRNKLHESHGPKCCLGVACYLAANEIEINVCRNLSGNNFKYDGEENHLPKSVMDLFGFHSHSGGRQDGKFIKIGTHENKSLANANDAGCTFKQIADYIEKNWRML